MDEQTLTTEKQQLEVNYLKTDLIKYRLINGQLFSVSMQGIKIYAYTTNTIINVQPQYRLSILNVYIKEMKLPVSNVIFYIMYTEKTNVC